MSQVTRLGVADHLENQEVQAHAQKIRFYSRVTAVAVLALVVILIAGGVTCGYGLSPEVYGSLFGMAGVSLITVVLASCRGSQDIVEALDGTKYTEEELEAMPYKEFCMKFFGSTDPIDMMGHDVEENREKSSSG